MNICIYIRICTYTYVYMYIDININIYFNVHSLLDPLSVVQAWLHLPVLLAVRLCSLMKPLKQPMTGISKNLPYTYLMPVYTYTYVHTYIQIDTHICTYTHIHVYMCVYKPISYI
jgi:hypothetical protein